MRGKRGQGKRLSHGAVVEDKLNIEEINFVVLSSHLFPIMGIRNWEFGI
jgi:hypothetical protein